MAERRVNAAGSGHEGDGASGRPGGGPLPWVTVGWAIGLAVGRGVGGGLAAACLAVGLSVIAIGCGWLAHRRGGRRSLAMGLVGVAVVGSGVGWWSLRAGPARSPALAGWVSAESKLIGVSGRIVGEPTISASPNSGLGRYLFNPPRTWFTLAVDRVHSDGGDWPTEGRLLIQVDGADARLRAGDRVRCAGWLRRFEPPGNPGEGDFGASMRRQGVVGRLALKSPGNIAWLSDPTRGPGLAGRRDLLQDRASAALRHGLGPGAARKAALLEALVLGRRTEALEPTYQLFRRTGLAHVLSISGLHVGLLAVGAWLAAQGLSGRPHWGAMASLVAVGLYTLIVPWRVPIVRAGLMTAALCLGLGGRWRMRGITVLCVVALGWLVVRPGDLFAAGFQLSFGIVAALIAFANPLADRWLGRPSWGAGAGHVGWRRLGDRLGRYAVASLVAWLVATPLVAFHFGLISPVALPLTLLALPLVAGLLWAGLLKVALGLVWLPLGAWLAPVVGGLADGLGAMASVAASLPGAWLRVPDVSLAWVAATLAVVVALLTGRFAGRRPALLAAVALCIAWPFGARLADRVDPPALTVRALAVGEGSCFLLESGGERWLYDAGSRSSSHIGRFTIVPALRALGIDRLDTIVISHADYDHYSGVLEVARAIPVGRVVTTRGVIDEAAGQFRLHWARGPTPAAGTAHLLDGLTRLGVPVETVDHGWTDQLGAAMVEAIWPPRGRTFGRSNDNALVLRFNAAGRRVMMCGDIQGAAMTAMLDERRDIAADVCDLPHHGSYPTPAGRDDSPAVPWVRAVGPRVLLQSSGRARLRDDPWAKHLTRTPRLITARDGMATVRIDRDGRISWATFRE